MLGILLGVLATSAAGAPPGVSIVQTADGRVTASASGAPLKDVLRAYSEATGVEFTIIGPAEEPINIRLDEPLAPAEAIRTILGGRSSIGIFKPTSNDGAEGAERRLSEVWIFAGIAKPLRPGQRAKVVRHSTRKRAAPGSKDFTYLKKQALTSKDPHQRRLAVDALVGADEARAKAALVQVLLNDKDSQVRQAALDNMLWYDEGPPHEALKKAALRDESKEIRQQALEDVFIDRAEDDRSARKVLIEAIRDRDPEIRMAVFEALGDVALYDESDRTVKQALGRAIRDPDFDVRVAAIEVLEDNEMRKELREAAQHDAVAAVREAAKEALERLGEDD